MTSKEIREKFFEFFRARDHRIVPSAPIVVKDDPTLMFTNAGMNQFKDIITGSRRAEHPRIADTQKCLRVSGKHNDLEEVGHDTYHHTMFEMLGNWSFGDYFKKEAIDWAWELMVDVYGMSPGRLYATVYPGDEQDGLGFDKEAYDCWLKKLDESRVLQGSKEDNFWEMGDTGPCGPSSELHIDLRSDEERWKKPGKELVDQDHPLVVELWNLVFMEYNRLVDGSLEELPAKNVDTGLGFERLCMVLQNKTSNYDTDLFTPLVERVETIANVKYGHDEQTGVAVRVVTDHIRAITFSVADGQLPSNTGAGYVIRRILRRAVRYGYSYLGLDEPFLYQLVSILSDLFSNAFPEVQRQQQFIEGVVKEEEHSFLKTLEHGIKRMNEIIRKAREQGDATIAGKAAFDLYDTYGFPYDLTELIARENGFNVGRKGFEEELQKQKERSKQAAAVEKGDWVYLANDQRTQFVGYDYYEIDARVLAYRKVQEGKKKKEFYQLVLDQTPFYPEGGGQVGDRGVLQLNGDHISVEDTKKENELIIHYVKELPDDLDKTIHARINQKDRELTAKNHTATHLLHAALKQVLGEHVEQKGSLVAPDHLRFDISHYTGLSEEEIEEIERLVNDKIMQNIQREEHRSVPYEEAMQIGATALFGEKYGDDVRVIVFDRDYSMELCGGTHVEATGEIGLFKITSETGVAAGVRRIEAVTGSKAHAYIDNKLGQLSDITGMLKNQKDPVQGVQTLVNENSELHKEREQLLKQQANQLKEALKQEAEDINGITFIGKVIDLNASEAVKNICYGLRDEVPNLFLVLGYQSKGKPQLSVAVSDNLIDQKGLKAGDIVKELAKEIQGGGGGQPFFATAGGKDASGLQQAVEKARTVVGEV